MKEERAPRLSGNNPYLIGITILSFFICWIVSGSTGFLVYPLQNSIAMTLITAIVVVSLAAGKPRRLYILIQVSAYILTFFFFFIGQPAALIPGCALVIASTAFNREIRERRVLFSLSFVVFCYGLYRFVLLSSGAFWLFMDSFSSLISGFAGFMTGNKLKTGITFAGIDYLFLTMAWTALCLLHHSGKKVKKGLIWIGVILACHFIYLIILSYVPALLNLFPESGGEPVSGIALFAKKTIPWNLPLAALLIHGTLSVLLYRSTDWNGTVVSMKRGKNGIAGFFREKRNSIFITVPLVICISLLLHLFYENSSCEGKKIVIHEKGYLNWLRPQHNDYGRLSIGMYGNLPDFISSIGSDILVSPDLSEDDLSGADLLILIYPNEPWSPEHLGRIRRFVREGGSLLVMGEHTVMESDGGDRINDVIEPSAIGLNFDSTLFAVGGWLHSYETLAHPITSGIDCDRNQFGIVVGASLDVRFPARPLVIGKWGYADIGNPETPSMMGNSRYDGGEKLGDLVLVAEQRVGKGRIVVFGDTSSLSNGIIIGDHPFVGRLFAYLSNRGSGGSFSFRFGLAAVLAIVLAVVLLLSGDPLAVALCAIGFIVPHFVALRINDARFDIYPKRRSGSGIKISYIDFSHNNTPSAESWRPDGTMGLSLNLFRNGYLNFTLPEFKEEKLKQADLFVCIAPQSTIPQQEIQSLKEMVYDGLILIINAGYKERFGCEGLLGAFGFDYHPMYTEAEEHIVKENRPEPLGFFKSPYLSTGEYYCFVRFYAGWPVMCEDRNSEILAYGYHDYPMIILRRFGKGKVVFIGDTWFATNQNLERESGEPFEGMRENIHFWRWLLSYCEDRPMWIPPDPRSAGD
ncbi:MAG: hypothetical protein JW881_09495 [Spirochaetales bacterium]|nr:hypothetical protein [Spirochaetales bacterium]